MSICSIFIASEDSIKKDNLEKKIKKSGNLPYFASEIFSISQRRKEINQSKSKRNQKTQKYIKEIQNKQRSKKTKKKLKKKPQNRKKSKIYNNLKFSGHGALSPRVSGNCIFYFL